MKTKVNLNFSLLYRSVVLSLFVVGALFSTGYLTHLLLSAVFSSAPVFFALFGLMVCLGVLFTYDADAFQWNNNPRIAIVQERERDYGDE